MGAAVPRLHVDDLPQLRVEDLYRCGALSAGSLALLHWPSGRAALRCDGQRLTVVLPDLGAQGGPPAQTIRLNPSTARDREVPAFACPACSRRTRTLSLRAGLFRCRRCHGLDYRSRHSIFARYHRAAALRRALGGAPSPLAPFPPRPHDPDAALAYDRLVLKILVAERRGLKGLRAFQGEP